MAFEVVGVGHCAVDYLGLMGRYPEADSKVELEQFSMQGGGPVATALVTLSTYGVSCSFIGKISDDDFGVFIRHGLREAGVDTGSLVVERDRVSAMSFIAVEKDSARRTIFWTRGSVSPLRPEELDLDLVARAQVLHLDGIHPQAQIAAARHARKHGVHVVLDGGTPREGWQELLGNTDTLIASERFASETASGTLAESLHLLSDHGPGTVVITIGQDGSVGMENGETYIVPALEVKAVDTTGAGDVYHGAYIYALLQGWGLRERMRFASAAAALKCRALGGRAGIADLQKVLQTLSG